ncbi:DUF2254 domain-containing protein [Nocardiopsis sp. L17-MgMaSL7]|uniref:DUF2254 domain-containing protein n=1 Tax=Nocardiopsis sp. L17-MgMaSL7 TaxID=1938893 RepID=UPI000D71D5FB|nr:DUF2254 family protein [Nocardiopsis sp. L17-MgMaSL7]PWV55145.1 putative membrane protein [Nocardiopsis sp. L17-MgMaSL7]
MARTRRLAGWAIGERVRESFVLVPVSGMVLFALLVPLIVTVDALVGAVLVEFNGGDPERARRDLADLVESGRTVIQTIGPATLTVMGVVFSVTLVAIQMATTKLSPRIIYLFTRSWTTKITLTVFLGTFVYTVGVLYLSGLYSDEEHPFVPLLSTFLAVLLLVLCLVSFLFFVGSTVNLMRVTYVMDLIARGSLEQIRLLARTPSGVEGGPSGALVTRVRSHAEAGVLTWVDERALARWARRNDAFVRVVPSVGDYVPGYGEVLVVHSSRRVRAPERAARTLHTGRERSTYQDPAFGLRQIVDIGVRAQGFGENDPTTVVQCVDRVQPLVAAFSEVSVPAWTVCDRRGVPRVRVPMPSWEGFVDLAFAELVLQSEGHTQVTRRLAAALRDLEAEVAQEHRPALGRYREELRRVCEHHLPGHLVEFALTPDRQGLGGGSRGAAPLPG